MRLPHATFALLALVALLPASAARAEDAAEPDVNEIRGYVGYNQVLIQLIEPVGSDQ